MSASRAARSGRPQAKLRLDRAVHAAGLAASREKAQALILAGRIRVDGQLRDKPGATVAADATITLTTSERPYVSRGGEKLAGVLAPLAVDPGGLACLDVGSSTGGFTDVLLRAGAARVTAVDVGRGLIDASLRRDPRVELVEGVNARYLLPEQVSPPYDLITVDVSFISLTLVLPQILPLAPRGRVLALVKPQFEVGRQDVGSGGVVRDPRSRARAVRKVVSCLTECSWTVRGVRRSPLKGPKGNVELFVLAQAGPVAESEAVAEDLEATIDEEVHGESR